MIGRLRAGNVRSCRSRRRSHGASKAIRRRNDCARSSCLIAIMLAGYATIAAPAHAQTYPNRPIKVIVPFPPGGPTDGMARIISERLGAVLGQSIVIENRGGGAGGSIGAKTVAAAEPDGYTILMTPGGSLTTGPAVHKNIGYDPLKVFTPIGQLIETHQFMCVHPDVPVKTLPELVAYARANPGKITYGYAGLRHRHAPAHRVAQARSRHRYRVRALSRHRRPCSLRSWPARCRWSPIRAPPSCRTFRPAGCARSLSSPTNAARSCRMCRPRPRWAIRS